MILQWEQSQGACKVAGHVSGHGGEVPFDFGVCRGLAVMDYMQNAEPVSDHCTCWLCHPYPPGVGLTDAQIRSP